MSKKEKYSVEVQKGPVSTDEQYCDKLRREPEHTMQDMELLRMRQDMMTLKMHTPKQ